MYIYIFILVVYLYIQATASAVNIFSPFLHAPLLACPPAGLSSPCSAGAAFLQNGIFLGVSRYYFSLIRLGYPSAVNILLFHVNLLYI